MKFPLVSVIFAVILVASTPTWKNRDPQQWTSQDAERILDDSPWSQSAGVTFSSPDDSEPAPPGPLPGAADAGMAGPRGATDGHWDGGVGRMERTGPPALNVTVRWDSAFPITRALEITHAFPYTSDQLHKDYILTVIGLVPSANSPLASSDARSNEEARASNVQELRAGVMQYSRLYPKGSAPLRPEDAQIDSATGALHLFFPRSSAINLAQKEITFETRFGSLSVLKRFRLKDMVFKGQLEL